MLWVLIMLLGIRTEALAPGIKAEITLKGLDYGKEVGMEFLNSALLKLSIPDLKGSYSIPLVGPVEWAMTGFQVKALNLGESLIAFVPNSGLKLSMGPAEAEVDGHWSVVASLIRDGGTLSLNVRDVTLAVQVGVHWNGAGRLVVSSESCSSHIGRLEVTFHGGASWLYNIFFEVLEDLIRKQLNSKLCESIGNAVQTLERTLQTIPESRHISPLADLNCSLVAAPLIMEQSIELDFKGEFYSPASHKEFPVPPAPFSLWKQNDHMLLLGVSDFVANSAAFVYYQAGALSRTFNDSQIPKWFPIRLNTKNFKNFVPELQKRFPNTTMALKIFARLPPRLQSQSGALKLVLPGALQAFVLPKGNSAVPVFLLDMDTEASGQVFASGKNIGASLKLTNFSLTLAHSDVGPFQVDKLEMLMNVALKLVILPKINRKLKNGFPLPTLPKASLQDMVINIEEGFLAIATDVHYGA